jgi:hypothetical protein|tara:strand:+ start:626 stop:910 length:285 start_codon:yes stop_codon:yes gene_type:complete
MLTITRQKNERIKIVTTTGDVIWVELLGKATGAGVVFGFESTNHDNTVEREEIELARQLGISEGKARRQARRTNAKRQHKHKRTKARHDGKGAS